MLRSPHPAPRAFHRKIIMCFPLKTYGCVECHTLATCLVLWMWRHSGYASSASCVMLSLISCCMHPTNSRRARVAVATETSCVALTWRLSRVFVCESLWRCEYRKKTSVRMRDLLLWFYGLKCMQAERNKKHKIEIPRYSSECCRYSSECCKRVWKCYHLVGSDILSHYW